MMRLMRLWILGAPDPEMEKIEMLLAECGERVEHATVDGRRVHPGNAYSLGAGPASASWLSGSDVQHVYLVECCAEDPEPSGSDWWSDTIRLPRERVTVVDHHRHGDRGFGRPPEEFLPASSLGQVLSELARLGTPEDFDGSFYADQERIYDALSRVAVWRVAGVDARDLALTTEGWAAADGVVIDDLVLAAAADHCLSAAYQGRCPGVDPLALLRWRAESRAVFQGRSVEVVLADVEAATAALREAPLVVLEHADIVVRDMRRPEPIPELPEAAARIGESYISGPLVGPDGRHKFTCSSPDPATVQAFLDCAESRFGLCDLYGDPQRGFAGGYEEVES